MLNRLLCLALGLVALSSCETSTPRKPKPVPPSAGIDEKPWNRPHSWENNARFGGMMPQSH
jgi:hypothetical protein